MGMERTQKELSTHSTGSVLLFWHDSILLSPLIEWATALRPVCVLISNSRDGDLASEMSRYYRNFSFIRVKHTARATALVESCKLLEEGKCLFITPDGPRGPRHQIKLGALYACQKSGATIIPIVYAASSQKTLSSWDRFKIPLPFSRILLSLLEPVTCPQEGSLDEVGAEIRRKMEEEEAALKTLLDLNRAQKCLF
jgi:lysophospholipid acyltransferase (LPLAT)-like uncharacterized protein